MNRLMLAPTENGYSVQFGNVVNSQQLQGGQSRFEVDILGASNIVAVSWLTDAGGYQYLSAFHRLWQRNPSQAFLVELIIDDHALQEYECRFVPSSFSLASLQGLAYTVNAQLEVKAKAPDEVFDQAIVDAWDGGSNDWAGQLEQLTNSDLPDALENTEEVAS